MADDSDRTELLDNSGAACLTALKPGSRLGHYVVQRKLGAGGMGQVFEAVDENLRRSVAIKVLPPERTGSGPAKARFQREAQAASALNHPNIVTVYEVGREGDIDFLAMELIGGRTLSQIIGGRCVDVRNATTYAIQIADALATAHQAGIVHRDLKPGNVMLTDRDLVKVLDFGLAKRTATEIAGPAESTVTLDRSLTHAGRAVGTLSYMAPEQMEAKQVDARADIFSFGCVMYEMLSGQHAFQADNSMGIAAAVLSKEPQPLHELSPGLPRSLERIVEKCLRKKPVERWQHMGDVKLLLEDVRKELDEPAPATAAAVRSKSNRFRLSLLLAALTGALLSASVLQLLRRRAAEAGPEPVLRMVTADSGLSGFPALSKDGKLIAFASDRSKEGNLDIWLQQIGGSEPIRLTSDPADESDPAFSPDGTRNSGVCIPANPRADTPSLHVPVGVRTSRYQNEVGASGTMVYVAHSVVLG